MAVHPLRPATRRRLGRPLPHQQADRPRAHPIPQKLSTTISKKLSYPVLDPVSQAYPEVQGRSPTCYSPVRHSSTSASTGLSVRLACVKHAASVHPEPGSNSPQKMFQQKQAVKSPIPNQKRTNQHHKQMLDWHKNKKSKNYWKPKNFQPTPTLTGQKQGLATCIMHSQMKHTTQMIRQSMVHPTTTGTHQNDAHTMAHNTKHTTTQNALAHYRVLKQHQHTQQPHPFKATAV